MRFYILISLFFMLFHGTARAEADWYSVTWDNDAFVGSDNGYSAGIYFSWFDTAENNKPEIGFLARSMAWSLPDSSDVIGTASAATIGQSMITPDDISLEDPPEGDLPYAGLLFYSDTYIVARSSSVADRITASIGVVGEYSLAGESQEFLHGIIGSTEPEGWDTQIDNELVFQFSRGRVWQGWTSSSGRQDIVITADAALGTISSSAGASAIWRFGDQLDRSFATVLLTNGRTANPSAVDNGWYSFLGSGVRYTPNSIFLDGNTYKDSRKVDDWDHEQIQVTAGFSYAAKNWSFTYAINDTNIIGNDDNDQVDEYSRYGTITFAWRGG